MTENILEGPKQEDHVKMGIGEYFWQTANKHGCRIFQIHADTDQKQTFAEVKQRVVRVAIQLRKMGLNPKEVVMVSGENDLDYVVPVLAASLLGAYVVASISFLEVFGNRIFMTDVKPKFIFVVENQLSNLEETIKSMNPRPKICVIGKSMNYPTMYEMEKTETEEEHSFKPFNVNIHDIAFILFSSGTTSMPKGISVSHFSILAGPCRANSEQSYVIDFPFVQLTTLFWISSVWILAYSIISAQPRIVAPSFDAGKFFKVVDKYKVQHSFVTYGLFREMANARNLADKYDLSSMKIVLSGGSSVDPISIHENRKIFPNALVFQTYGSTEMGTTATFWNDFDKDSYETKLSSVGKVNCNVEMKIVDIDTRKVLGPNKQGEILVRSPYRMIGYFSQQFNNIFDEDGFLKTGDIGFYDEQGYVYLIDRLNETFKVRGITIYPKIIEELLKSHPSISESVVIGINQGLDLYHIAACVVLKENAQATVQEISDYIVKIMNESYRLTGGIKFMKKIPMTPSGKTDIRKVKQLFYMNAAKCEFGSVQGLRKSLVS